MFLPQRLVGCQARVARALRDLDPWVVAFGRALVAAVLAAVVLHLSRAPRPSRAQWRSLAIAIGATLAIAMVSFAVAPGLWFQWVERLTGDTGTAGSGYMALLVGRLALAAVLVAVGAMTNRAWLVPVAATIAVPIIWPDSLAMLLAAVYLIRHRPSRPVSIAA